MDYAIYDPTITTVTAVDPYNDPSGLTYVSNSSLAYWEGTFWAIMDGTTAGVVEGSTGQKIYLTTSVDGTTWTPAVPPFGVAAHCNNPMTDPTLQWQPNLVVVGAELWCTWTGLDSYLSKLTSPTGKWTNYRFEFSGAQPYLSSTVTGAATGDRSLRCTVGGVADYYGYFSQNPIILSSGVVVCPLTFESDASRSVQTPATSDFTRKLKFNALLTTTDGTTWSMTAIDTSAFGDFCAWEPFVVENPVGHVYVFSRNLDARVNDEDFMLVSHSTDGGATFSSSVSTKMLVPTTRGFARQITPHRWLMTHIDHPQNSDHTADQGIANVRINGALFMSRRGLDDFIPGVNFTGHDRAVNYPQFIVGPDEALYINYTSGLGFDIRRSLRIVKVTPLPDDDTAYIHPRSVNAYTSTLATNPTLHSASTPPYYDFNGANKALSVTPLTASTGVTYAAWLKWDTSGDTVIDSRTGGAGQVLVLRGLVIGGLNFFHGWTLAPDTATFLAAVIDNSTNTVTLYAGTGSGVFQTKIGYFKSILFAGQPADGDTLAANAITYTFRTSASLTNDVAIGASTAATIINLRTKLTANSMSSVAPGSNRLIMSRSDIASFSVSSGSSQVTVETGVPLDGSVVNFGKAISTSSLAAYAGRMYEARLYNSPLNTANLTYLYNAKAASVGYSAMGGISTSPGSPFLFLDPANPNPTEFPSLGTAAHCEVVGSTLLRIHGEGSAAVEMPYGATELTFNFKLSDAPSSTDKYVIATFGSASTPLRLYIDSTNPAALYANGQLVATFDDPTNFNEITVVVSTNKITVGTFEQYFSGKPRCYLGSALPEGLLAVSKTIDYDVSTMTAVSAEST